jgi:DUF4097 and DUF4098 domain-containing protein YvlB
MMFIATALLALAAAGQADTTFAVSTNDRLSLEHHAGSVEIRVWDRDEVQIMSDDDDPTIQVDRAGSAVRVGRRGRHATHGADYQIRVPAWLPITFNGVNTDFTVRGMAASVRGNTVNGDIWIIGGSGLVSIRAINGDATVERVTGRVDVESVDGDVAAMDIVGLLKASTVDGDVTLERITSESVDGSTVDGDVFFSGKVHQDGRYKLATHDGDVTFLVPEEVDATVKVSTFSGDFESDFPFTITKLGGNSRRFTFALGSGSAEIILEAFDGTIALRRAGDN